MSPGIDVYHADVRTSLAHLALLHLIFFMRQQICLAEEGGGVQTPAGTLAFVTVTDNETCRTRFVLVNI